MRFKWYRPKEWSHDLGTVAAQPRWWVWGPSSSWTNCSPPWNFCWHSLKGGDCLWDQEDYTPASGSSWQPSCPNCGIAALRMNEASGEESKGKGWREVEKGLYLLVTLLKCLDPAVPEAKAFWGFLMAGWWILFLAKANWDGNSII